MEKEPLILGLDPGATVAYSLIDLKGDLVALESTKQFNKSSLTLEIIAHGKVIVVSTDVFPVPSFVSSFAKRFRAKLISPKASMLADDKKILTLDFNFSNIHERDALAASLFAYRKIRPLLIKIDTVLRNENKEIAYNKIVELVIKNNLGIRAAINAYESQVNKGIKEQKPIVNTPRKVVEQKRHNNYMDTINRLNYKNKLLKTEIINLKTEIKKLERKLDKEFIREKIKTGSFFKDEKIYRLEENIKNYKDKIMYVLTELQDIDIVLGNIKDYTIIKKLKNLGIDEFKNKNKILDIKENDILFVEDLGNFSTKVIAFLKNKVIFLFTDKKVYIPYFYVIESKNYNLVHTKNFVFVKAKEIEKDLKNKDLIMKIIKDYREDRSFKYNSLP